MTMLDKNSHNNFELEVHDCFIDFTLESDLLYTVHHFGECVWYA